MGLHTVEVHEQDKMSKIQELQLRAPMGQRVVYLLEKRMVPDHQTMPVRAYMVN